MTPNELRRAAETLKEFRAIHFGRMNVGRLQPSPMALQADATIGSFLADAESYALALEIEERRDAEWRAQLAAEVSA